MKQSEKHQGFKSIRCLHIPICRHIKPDYTFAIFSLTMIHTMLNVNNSVHGMCIFSMFSLWALKVHVTVFVCSQLQLFSQLHGELDLYYTQLLDDVVKTCLSTVKYPSASSSSNQVQLALMYCRHIKFCAVLDTNA